MFGQNQPSSYSFFVAGHTYGEPGVNSIGFHPPFKQKFSYLQERSEIKFGVLTGDIVSPGPTVQDWEEVDADIETLGLPVYFAVGNHDMENRELFESRYGQTYYSFIYQNDLFITLDPNIDGWNISGDQLQFLQNTVSDFSPTVNNIYVFFHQILWKDSDNQFNYIHWNSSSGRDDTINFWTDVEPLFRNLPNKVVMFAGDLGASWSSNVTYDSYDNMTFIASGMGDEDGENFIVVNVNADKSVNYDLICLSDSNINCLGMLTDYIVVSDASNINDLNFNEQFETVAFPNPIIDNITVLQNKGSHASILIYNLQGSLLLEDNFSGKFKQTINLSNFSAGMYIMHIVNDNKTTTIKLIKN